MMMQGLFPLQIEELCTGLHFFKAEIESIPLTTNKTSEEVFWYVNGRHQKLPRLNLATHNGKIKVTACMKMDCDSVEIYVH